MDLSELAAGRRCDLTNRPDSGIMLLRAEWAVACVCGRFITVLFQIHEESPGITEQGNG